MTHALTYVATISLALSYCCAVSAQPAGPQRPGPGSGPARSVAERERERTEQMHRERALEELGNQYREVRKTLMGSLEQAAKEHRDDRRYMSPLFCAIAAVEGWRVFEAEAQLFSIIDYELDVSSLPLGIDVGGDFFYPAAGALVKLRVDARKVTKAIARADNDRQIQLLTWVLYQRAGTVEEAKRILESEKDDPHVATAIGMVGRGRDLLSRLPKAATAPAATQRSAKPAFQSYEMSTTRPEPLDPARLDRISDGMTLAAIVDELGPGWMSPDSGAGIITWFFDNGRHLMVWPSRYEPSEIITRKGVSGRSRMWIGTDTSRQLPTTNPAATQRWVTSQPSVIGALGIPLGTVAEIRASVVAGSETGTKQHDGSYLLRVTEIDGRPIAVAPVLEFSVPSFVQVKLANDDFGLYELKTGTKAGELDSVEIKKLQKGYVGKQVRLVVYETGGYSGIPSNLPKDVMAWSDRGFGFSTSLVVLAERP